MEARVKVNTYYVADGYLSCPLAHGVMVLLEHCGGEGDDDGNNSNIIIIIIIIIIM